MLGPSAVNRSIRADDERTVNWYLERTDEGLARGKTPFVLHGTPGYKVFASLNGQPIRGLFWQDGRGFAVAGKQFFEFFASGDSTLIGTVDEDADPATISSNGTNGFQLFITSGGEGYIYSLASGLFNVIADVDLQRPIKAGAFMDGYFVSLKDNSSQFQLSELNDGLLWDGTQVAQRSTGSDHVVAMIVEHRNLWLIGSKTSEIWYDSGNASFPFQPIPGAFLESGAIAAFSPQIMNEGVYWLAQSERGDGIVNFATGYQPTRISTHALEHHIQGFPRLDNAIGFTYQQEGHAFYLLFIPLGDTHQVWDGTTRSWHERALWDVANHCYIPDIGRNHVFGFGKHLVGDRRLGVIYEMSLDVYKAELLQE